MIRINDDNKIIIFHEPEDDSWVIRIEFPYFGKRKTLSLKTNYKFLVDLYKTLQTVFYYDEYM